MRPSAYDAASERQAKDEVVEDRDGVKVLFVGGNVYRLHVEDADQPETVRGANKAWERAEAIRKQLNPGYEPPADETGSATAPTASEGDKTDGEESAPQGEQPPAANPPAPNTANPPAEDKTEDGDDAEEDAEEAQTPANGDGTIRIGGDEYPLRLVPVDAVEAALGDSQGRVATLQGQSETRRLHKRVRATDGRCAPIFFTRPAGSKEGDEFTPALFSGIRTFAAAKNLGMKHVAVVILPADRAREVQGAVVALHKAALAAVGDEDEMLFRAYIDD